MLKFDTATGGTVEAQRVGIGWDIHVRAAGGRTIATVSMSDDDARGLMADLRSAH